MLKYLLDTDLCIYAMAKRSEKLRRAFAENESRMAMSSVTLMELTYGAEKSQHIERNLAVLEDFVARVKLLPFDPRAATQAGQIRAELERQGKPIGSYDLMIAGHARAEGLVLVSNNQREFKRVASLRSESWI